MITSSANGQMKRIALLNRKAKARYEQQVFVAEGMKMCFEAPKASVQTMYVSESFLLDEGRREKLAGYRYEVVADPVFRSVSDTETPQGILCLVKMPQYGLEDMLCAAPQGMQAEGSGKGLPGKNAQLLVLEGIQDPGNLGTMIRTGEAAGMTGIIMDKSTVDLFHPKTVRATMGSLYRMPYYISPSLPDTIRMLQGRGVFLYAAHLRGAVMYDQPDYRKAIGFLIGNEGKGLSPQAAGLADSCVRIPMEGSIESLNAAVAAALLMYEANRQRR